VALGPHRTGVVAGKALGVGPVLHGEAQRRVEPPLRVADVLRVERQPRGEGAPRRFGGCAQDRQRRPGTLGVDVVRGDRRNPAPVVDAGVEQVAERVLLDEVWRRLDVDLRRQQQPGERDGTQVLLRWAGRRGTHRRARLRQEVLDENLLHVPVPVVAAGDRLQRLDPVGLALADADEDAGGEGDLQPPGRLEGGQPPLGRLVGRPPGRGQVGAQRLEHHSLRRRHLAQPRERRLVERARVGVRQQAGLLHDEPAHRDEVVDRRRVALLAEPVARGGVPQLGRFAEVNSASAQPDSAPRAATARTSSGERYGAASVRGAVAKVQ